MRRSGLGDARIVRGRVLREEIVLDQGLSELLLRAR